MATIDDIADGESAASVRVKLNQVINLAETALQPNDPAAPSVPLTSPTVQDVIDALVSIGLVVQED